MTRPTIFNTLTREVEPFVPLDERDVRFFVCGPTVYGPMHAGHGKTYTQFDFIARVLRRSFPHLRYVQNITDVDDKIIRKAQEEGRDPIEVARQWEAHYQELMALMGNDQVDAFYRAHDHVDEVIDQVQRMLDAGKAYSIEGQGIYFDISTFPQAGQLARRGQTGEEQSRLEDGVLKRHAGDFVVWKSVKPGEPSWDAPFGAGRPGWHIEDTAITEKYLGASYDIHGGATDLIFPHHEAEIAQMESLSGQPLVKYWMHTGLLEVDGQKMGKSLNNFVTLQDLINRWGAKALRYAFLSSSYRSTMSLTDEVLEQVKVSLERVNNYYATAAPNGEAGEVFKGFLEAVHEDFNTSKALAVVFQGIREGRATKGDLEEVDELMGGVFELEAKAIPEGIHLILQLREEARERKDWATSDRLRDELKDAGWEVRDEAGKTVVRPL